jgi:integrase
VTGRVPGYATWRKYLKLAQSHTAAHPDGIVGYTAHELRHVCASLLIASGASDMQVAHQMGHSKIETTKNIYGHLFAQDRASMLDAAEPGGQPTSRLRSARRRGRHSCLAPAGPTDCRAPGWPP